MFSLVQEPSKDVSSGPDLILQMGSSRYRVKGLPGTEVAPCPALVSVPRAPYWLLGIALFKGEALPVIALQALINGAASETTSAARILVLRDAGRALAYLIDDVDADYGDLHQARHAGEQAMSHAGSHAVTDLDLVGVSRVLMTQSSLTVKPR